MMGRPLALREEKILLKRERANLDMSGPNMGMFTLSQSSQQRPGGVCIHQMTATTEKTSPTKPTAQYCLRYASIAIITRVGKGSSEPNCLNILAKVGITKVTTTKKAAIRTPTTSLGQRVAAFTLSLVTSSYSCRAAMRFRVSSRWPEASPARTILT